MYPWHWQGIKPGTCGESMSGKEPKGSQIARPRLPRDLAQIRDRHPGNLLILLSSADRAGLLANLDQLATRLEVASTPVPAAHAPPSGHSERLAIVSPPSELRSRLMAARKRLEHLQRPRLVIRQLGVYFGSDATAGRVAFLFPGQGSQHIEILRKLYGQLPAVRKWFDALDEANRRLGAPLPSRLIFPSPDMEPEARRELEAELFDMGHGAQLSTVASLALYEVLGELGLEPDRVLGHSNGEHAAVIVAHMAPAAQRDLVCAWCSRTSRAGRRLGRPDRPERMSAVSAVELNWLKALVARYPGELFLAMDNCPHQHVLAGREATVNAAVGEIVQAGGLYSDLPFTRAYHTPLFSAGARTLASHYAALPLNPARIPVFSCLTGGALPADPDAVRRFMAQQWTAPLGFRETIESLYAEGTSTFIEVGSDSKLTAFVEDTLRGRPHLAVPTSSPNRDSCEQLQHMLAALHAHGITLDPRRFEWLSAPETAARPASMPLLAAPQGAPSTVPEALPRLAPVVAAHRKLIDLARMSQARMAAQLRALTGLRPDSVSQATPRVAVSPLLGDVVWASPKRLSAERRFTRAGDPFVDDHSLGRRTPGRSPTVFPLPVLAFTISLEIMAEAARRLAGTTVAVLSNMHAHRWLALDDGALSICIEAEHRGPTVHAALFESAGERWGNAPGPAAEGTIQLIAPPAVSTTLLHADPIARPPAYWTPEMFYRRYAFHGPSFQGITRVLTLSPTTIEAELVVTTLPGLDTSDLQSDPALLDCAGQLMAFWLLEQDRRDPSFGIFPFAARRITLYRAPLPPGHRLRCRGHITQNTPAITESTFVFLTCDDRPVATIEGLQQILIALPQTLARCIFGGETPAFSCPAQAQPSEVVRRIDVGDWAFLTENGGIWERALAHLILSETERAIWLRSPLPSDQRLHGLLTQLVAKETVRNWAEQHNLVPPEATDIIIIENRLIVCSPLGPRCPKLTLRHQGGTILAVVK